MTAASPFVAWRLALVYAAVFLWVGAYMPYWPVWLGARGMSPAEVGILLGVSPWVRVIASPLAGRWADRSGRAHRLVQGLAIALVSSLFAFELVDGFGALLVLMMMVGLLFAPIVPLVDGITLGEEAQGRLSYGPVRLWGSAAFILASWIGGEMLEREGEAIVLWLLIGAAAVLALASFLLPSPHAPPRVRPPPLGAPVPLPPAHVSSVATEDRLRTGSRPFLAFLCIAGLLHLSHAVLYGFGTMHWRNQGLDEGTVGMLWAEGVLAEILLFAFARQVGSRLSPQALWVLAGVGGAIRWSVLATTTVMPWLVLAQALHGLTFGALHLGAMNYLRSYVRVDARAHATTLYSAASAGVALGIGLPLVGALYADVGGAAYWAMAASSALAVVLALGLRTRPA